MNDNQKNQDHEKIRYALGLFARIDDLEKAILAIKAAELPLDQVKVIAPPVPPGTVSQWGERMAHLGAETWIVSEASGPCPWDMAPVSQPRMQPTRTKRDVMPNFHIWALERHAQQLDRHLRAGGGIAVVRVKTDAEERVAYAILLRHATAGVQTHEVRSSQNGR